MSGRATRGATRSTRAAKGGGAKLMGTLSSETAKAKAKSGKGRKKAPPPPEPSSSSAEEEEEEESDAHQLDANATEKQEELWVIRHVLSSLVPHKQPFPS